MISRIIKVEVGVINRSRRLRPWFFWISQKPNLIIVLFYIERKRKWNPGFCLFTDSKQHNCGARSWHDYPWLWVSLAWLLWCILQLDDVRDADFENSMYTFGQSEKRKWVQCIIVLILRELMFSIIFRKIQLMSSRFLQPRQLSRIENESE